MTKKTICEAITKYLHTNNITNFDLTTALIDMDGVLYDSMKNHTAAWLRMVTEIGIDAVQDEFYQYEGMTGTATINLLFQRAFGRDANATEIKDLYSKKAKYFIELGEPIVITDADKMLNTLRQNGIKRILVTGSAQGSLLKRLDSDYPSIFEHNKRITALDVTQGKPHPEPYLKGMKLAHSQPHQSIVIENAPLGVAAGHASGSFTIGITTGPIPKQEMWNSGADLVFESMTAFAQALPEIINQLKKITINDYYNPTMEHQTIIFSNDIDSAINNTISKYEFNKIIVLTDVNTQQFVLPTIAENKYLANASFITIKSGDINKNLEATAAVWKSLIDCNATRKSILINLGGGVVTDLGGFVASTFKRGMRFINIPTTLLGAVDAAIGGKTGINFNGLKNEIGVFNEASAVIVSTLFFKSLPLNEIKSGYAEMLKHGLISDKESYDKLIAYDFTASTPDHLLELLEESVAVKRRIVDEDPHENGIRKALNLGHTAAHALESLAMKRQSPIPHGYAVAWGLVIELIVSHLELKFDTTTVHQLAKFVNDNYGAFDISCDDYPAILNYMSHDKKSDSGEINFSLLSEIGKIKINCTVEPEQVKTALDIYRDLMHI